MEKVMIAQLELLLNEQKYILKLANSLKGTNNSETLSLLTERYDTLLDTMYHINEEYIKLTNNSFL